MKVLVGAFNQEKVLVGAVYVIVKLQSSRKFVCSSTASAAAVSSADLDVTLSLQVRAVLQFVKPFVCGGSGAHFLILSYSIVANSGLANSRVGRVSLCKSAVRVTWCYASSQQQGYEWDLRTHTQHKPSWPTLWRRFYKNWILPHHHPQL